MTNNLGKLRRLKKFERDNPDEDAKLPNGRFVSRSEADLSNYEEEDEPKVVPKSTRIASKPVQPARVPNK